jgi:hypothetical protein
MTGGGFASGIFLRWGVRASGELEVFAVIAEVLFGDWFGASVAALLGGMRVITGAVEADAEIGAALETRFASAG